MKKLHEGGTGKPKLQSQDARRRADMGLPEERLRISDEILIDDEPRAENEGLTKPGNGLGWALLNWMGIWDYGRRRRFDSFFWQQFFTIAR